MTSFTKRFAALFVTGAIMCTPAQAQSGQELFDELKAALVAGGITLTADSVDDEGAGSFSAAGVKVVGDEAEFTAQNFDVEGVERNETGALVDSIAITDLMGSLPDDVTMALDTFTLDGLSIPSKGTADLAKLVRYYSSFALENMTIGLQGKTIATMERGEGSAEYDESAQTYSDEVNFSDITIDVEATPEGEGRTNLIELGYSKINASMTSSTSYNAETGVVSISGLELLVEDAFTFSYTMKIGGITPDVLQVFRGAAELDAQTSALNSQEQEAEMNRKQLAALMQLSLIEMTYELEDDSIVQRVLDKQSKAMGMTADELAERAPAFVSMGMSQLNTPEFTASVAAAVGEFLKEQGTLSVSIKPANPVPFMQLAMTASLDPISAIKNYNVVVEAK